VQFRAGADFVSPRKGLSPDVLFQLDQSQLAGSKPFRNVTYGDVGKSKQLGGREPPATCHERSIGADQERTKNTPLTNACEKVLVNIKRSSLPAVLDDDAI
jgi:hypothetical protein